MLGVDVNYAEIKSVDSEIVCLNKLSLHHTINCVVQRFYYEKDSGNSNSGV